MKTQVSTGRQLGDVDRHVGQRVKLARAIAGVTQEKLGEAIGITFQQVQKYEKGINRIGAGRLQQIAAALGTSVDFFFEDVPQPAPIQSSTSGQAETALFSSFLSIPEAVRLMRSFARIPDTDMRRLIVELTEKIAR